MIGGLGDIANAVICNWSSADEIQLCGFNDLKNGGVGL
jgi:hypothetical protein